jgi:hypothetical protein
MAKGFKHGSGGGASLNFKVVGGTAEPASPKENTIWVNTDVEITSWVCSFNEPKSPVEGMVWITTSTSSSAEFNALKKNSIMVYPMYAKQYVSGAWVEKTAKTYQNGAWVDWVTYLYDKGNLFEDFTGNWVAKNVAYNGSYNGTSFPTINNNPDNLYIIQNGAQRGGVAHMANKIDLTGFNTLYFDGMLHSDSSSLKEDRCFLGIWSEFGTYKDNNLAAYIPCDEVDGLKTLNISALSGLYYIGFFLWNIVDAADKSYVRMKQMWLE